MGGGGGGSRGLSREELRSAELRAKRTLGEGQGKSNVFISFSSDDLDEVNLLRGQARNENSNIEFNDWSLKKPFDSKEAEYIKRGIRERIRQSSVTVVYLSEKTAGSKWVDWEIRESLRMGKGVIAMHKGDRPPARLPRAIGEHNIRVVPWNQEQLSRAIDRESGSR